MAEGIVERERRMNDAARRYLKGEMSCDEYRAVCRQYGPDYRAAARALANQQLRPAPLWRRFRRWLAAGRHSG